MMEEFLDEVSLYGHEHTCVVTEELVLVYQRFPHAWNLRRSTYTVFFFLSVYGMERGIMLRLAILF